MVEAAGGGENQSPSAAPPFFVRKTRRAGHPRKMRWLCSLLLFAFWLVLPSPARACAVCSQSSPTLVGAGSEQAYDGRLRASVDGRAGSARTGSGPGLVQLDDRRLELALAYAPTPDFLAAVVVPGLYRWMRSPRASGGEAVLGDVDARTSYRLWSSGDRQRQLHLVSGLKLPTAPLQADREGRPLSAELQPGCGSLVPYLGVDYTATVRRWTLSAGGSIFVPVPVREGPHPGYSARARAAVQVQPIRYLAARTGVSARFDATGELGPERNDPNSGGLVGYLTAGILVSPTRDLVVSLEAFFPVLQALRGEHRELTIFGAGVAYDFR